ncbi:MAG TPA: hypothetical protein VK039_00775, partial [Brevibacterium sp.]|nr:hypothetical protein [Brevibacterium sp.]
MGKSTAGVATPVGDASDEPEEYEKMSDVDPRPAEVECTGLDPDAVPAGPVEVLTSREVPLGGPRAMTV